MLYTNDDLTVVLACVTYVKGVIVIPPAVSMLWSLSVFVDKILLLIWSVPDRT